MAVRGNPLFDYEKALKERKLFTQRY